MNDFSVSAIIPTLNEAEHIESLLRYLRQLDDGIELIVVDAHSRDRTALLAAKWGKVILAPPGRGIQMNHGAKIAHGEILWFLHADTIPHPRSLQVMKQALSDSNIVGGGFEYSLDHPGFRFRLVEFLSNRKNRLLRWLFGDMAIFVRKEIFKEMGGYKEIPLMEDMDFCKRLKKKGKIVILPQRINTSARRWTEDGYILHSIRSWIFQGAWNLGVSPHFLAQWYRFK